MPFIRTTPLHSEEIEEIIGQVPPSLVRRGIAGLFILVLVLVFSSMLVRYPTIVKARVGIYPDQQPFEVNWKTRAGRLIEVKVKSGDMVKSGDTLIVEHGLNKLPVPCISPIAGEVDYIRGQEKNTLSNTLLVTPTAQVYRVLLSIDGNNISGIKPGQPVSIQADTYRQSNYGTLDGRISYISRVPVHHRYTAEAVLCNGLTSNRNQPFYLGAGLGGTAEITVSNPTVFQIIFKRQ